MTLVAVTAQPTWAAILTDSHAYGEGGEAYFVLDKTLVLPSGNMATTSKGAVELGDLWQQLLLEEPGMADDIDGWAEVAQEFLPQVWRQVPDPTGTRRSSGRVLNVGWSRRRGRFVVHEFRAETAFRCVDRSDTPLYLAPTWAEAPSEPPADDQAWAELGLAAYQHCSLDLSRLMRDRQTRIGGDLVLTRLDRAQAEQTVIATIPEHDWQHRQMLIGTIHLYGQAGPCLCGSGQPAMLCHQSLDGDRPCRCGFGKKFRDCHQLKPTDPTVQAHWRGHVDDFHRTQDALAATWREVRPDEPIPWNDELRTALGLPHGVVPPGPAVTDLPPHGPCFCGSRRVQQHCCSPSTAVAPGLSRRDRRAAARTSRRRPSR